MNLMSFLYLGSFLKVSMQLETISSRSLPWIDSVEASGFNASLIDLEGKQNSVNSS